MEDLKRHAQVFADPNSCESAHKAKLLLFSKHLKLDGCS